VTGHLGPLAAALVDEQLSRADRDRALRHVASCDACRAEVEQQRAVKARLDTMGEPALPGSLLERLNAMQLPAPPPAGPQLPSPGQLPLAAAPFPSGRGSVGGNAVGGASLGGSAVGGNAVGAPLASLGGVGIAAAALQSTNRRRARRLVVGAASLVLVGGGAAYAAGGNEQSIEPVRPAVDVYTVQHGTTSGTVPLNDPAVTAVTTGFGR
jgi:anti-sigma factor RsiW